MATTKSTHVAASLDYCPRRKNGYIHRSRGATTPLPTPPHPQLDKWGFSSHLAKVELLFVAGNGRKSGHRAPQKLSTKQSRSKKYAGADSEVEKAGCGAWGVDFDDLG